MSMVGDLSTTASLCVLAAIILLSCCFYYFISRKQRQQEEPANSKKLKRWLPKAFSPLSASSSTAELENSRSNSVCSQQTINVNELIRAMEVQEKQETRYCCSGAKRMAIIMPNMSFSSIQEKQARFHRWLSTPSFHLTPIKEEVSLTIHRNNNDDRQVNAEARTPEISIQASIISGQQLFVTAPVVFTVSPEPDHDPDCTGSGKRGSL